MGTTSPTKKNTKKAPATIDYAEYLRRYGSSVVPKTNDDCEGVAKSITQVAARAFQAAFAKKPRHAN